MKIVSVTEGNQPIILAQPHGGTYVPEEILLKLSNKGKALADTDWHINKLYNGLVEDITVVESHIHRYVIDANRDPSDTSLYPGQNTTSLCPLTDFNGKLIYNPGQQPSSDEIQQRQSIYHQPYHDALAGQIARLREKYETVIVYDCHSIRSKIPFLFDGVLPDFNIGTYNGQSCSKQIENTVKEICADAKNYTHTVNGRFKGGWTTRHYGQPNQGVQAIQMELAQSTYMQEFEPWCYDFVKEDKLRDHLKSILKKLAALKN